MRSNGTIKILFIGVLIMLILVSASILAMPFSGKQALLGEDKYIYYTGIMFWTSLIISYVLILALLIKCKREIKAEGKTIKKSLPGILRFFSNSTAKVTDILFISSIIIFFIFVINRQLTSYISCVVMSAMFFLFHLHGILNSRLFCKLEEEK